MGGMSTTFNPVDHPRGGNPANTGEFSSKDNSGFEGSLPLPGDVNRIDLPETNKSRRGHKFYPSSITKWPALYSTEDIPLGEKPLHAHYFVSGCDWYIAEFDPETGIAFGYADLGFGGGEFGEIYLPELEAVVARPSGFPQVVERELDFKEGTQVQVVLPQYRPDEDEEAND